MDLFAKCPKKGKRANMEQAMAEASAYARQGNIDEARKRLDTLLEKYSGDFNVHLFAAGTCEILKDPEAQYRHLATALALDPKFFAIHYLLAKDALERGDRRLAESLLDTSWKMRKRGTPKDLQKAAKKSHYALLDGPVAADVGKEKS
jgi:tetratricopeptide (TPR) repeat protein